MCLGIPRIEQLLMIVDKIVRDKKPFNMLFYQKNAMATRPEFTGLCLSEYHTDNFISCDLSGYIAISDFFKASGGKPCTKTGKPLYQGLSGHRAIARWLRVDDNIAAVICGVDPDTYNFYGVDSLKQITALKVKTKLIQFFGEHGNGY